MLPPLWLELLCIGPVEVVSAVHAPGRIRDVRARGDEDGAPTVRPAAQGQDVVADGEAAVARHDGHEAERLVEHVFQVLHLLDRAIIRPLSARTNLIDLREELGPDILPPREDPPRIGQQPGRGVAAREEDVEQFAAQRVRVLGLFDELVQEDVAFGFFRVLLEVGGAVVVVRDRFGDDLVGELVHGFYAFGALAVGDPAAEAAALELEGHCFGGVDEAGGEVLVCLGDLGRGG